MFTDVTERKTLEEQFRQAQKLEAVGRFAGGVAHDFNNLLTVITGYSQLLLRRLRSDSALRVQVEKIETAAGQAANLTRQLLSFSRRRVFQPEVVDLNAVVTNFQKMCLPIIGEDLELVTKLDPLAGRVRADIGQLDQVLMNLVVNARDAMPRGRQADHRNRKQRIRRRFPQSPSNGQAGPYVLLAVSDTGCGMDADTQLHIFRAIFHYQRGGQRNRTRPLDRAWDRVPTRRLHRSEERVRRRNLFFNLPSQGYGCRSNNSLIGTLNRNGHAAAKRFWWLRTVPRCATLYAKPSRRVATKFWKPPMVSKG